MIKTFSAAAFGALFLSFSALAAPPADAPAGTTGLCKDGSYYSGASKKGACRGHKGVKEWYADADDKAPKADGKAEAKKDDAKAEPKKDEAKKEDAKPAVADAASAKGKDKKEPPKPAAEAAAGGGAGKVWVNESTKVYHCEGDRWYGKTKEGSYMSIADATAKGYKPSHGKACDK